MGQIKTMRTMKIREKFLWFAALVSIVTLFSVGF
jgi:hypothetical protein